MSNVQNMSLEDIMGDRFGRYSKYIIQERALPDIRDGLKPVQRRILYSMNKDGNTFDKGFRKSAKSVGNVMGNFDNFRFRYAFRGSRATDNLVRMKILYNFIGFYGVVLVALVNDNHKTNTVIQSVLNML